MITIVGAGIVGPVLARLLADQGIQVNVVDKKSLELKKDMRAISIAYGNKLLFEKISGLWENLEFYAQPIHEIRVLEKESSQTIDFEESHIHPLGYIVEYTFLQKELMALLDHSLIQCEFNQTISSVHRNSKEIEVVLESGKKIASSLLVGADGRYSSVRNFSSIKSYISDSYGYAIIGNLYHEEPHMGTAWEIFAKDKILALLPCLNHKDKNQSSFVFMQKKGTSFPPGVKLYEIFNELFPVYGDLDVQEPLAKYSLISLRTNTCIDDRVALIGDSAHVLHPLAGQGANLGWQDVKFLAEELVLAYKNGMDLGEQMVLERYKRKRKWEYTSFNYATKGLRSLFSTGCGSSIGAFGMSIINKIPRLKHFITRKAMKL